MTTTPKRRPGISKANIMRLTKKVAEEYKQAVSLADMQEMTEEVCDLLTEYRVHLVENDLDDRKYVGISTHRADIYLDELLKNAVQHPTKGKLSPAVIELGAGHFYCTEICKTPSPSAAKKRAEQLIWDHDTRHHGFNVFSKCWTVRPSKCKQHSRCVLTWEQVIMIKQLIMQGLTCLEIATRYGVAQSTISAIKCKRTWNHVEVSQIDVSQVRNRTLRLSHQHDAQVREMYKSGMSCQKIGKVFGVQRARIASRLKSLGVSIAKVRWTPERLHQLLAWQAEGWSYARMARELGVSRRAVAAALHRLRQREAA